MISMHKVKVRIRRVNYTGSTMLSHYDTITYRGRRKEHRTLDEREVGKYITTLLRRRCYDRIILDVKEGE